MTDARLLARQLQWAATTLTARDEVFNVVNGDLFIWSWMRERIATWFGMELAPFPGREIPLTETALLWAGIIDKYHLAGSNLNVLTSVWHTDVDLRLPSKS